MKKIRLILAAIKFILLNLFLGLVIRVKRKRNTLRLMTSKAGRRFIRIKIRRGKKMDEPIKPEEIQKPELARPDQKSPDLGAKSLETPSISTEDKYAEELGGDIAEAAFEIIHAFIPPWRPIDPKEKDKLSRPIARIAARHGWIEKLDKKETVDYVLLGVAIANATAPRIRECAAAAKKKPKTEPEEEKNARDDRRQAGEGKNNPSPAADPREKFGSPA